MCILLVDLDLQLLEISKHNYYYFFKKKVLIKPQYRQMDLDPKQFLTLITINLENVKEFLLGSSIPKSEWVARNFFQ